MINDAGIAIKAPIEEPNDTYPQIATTIAKIIITIKADHGVVASRTPKEVATAFPPLNFKNTGKTCPITAAIP